MVAHAFPAGKYFVGDPAYVLSEAMYMSILDTIFNIGGGKKHQAKASEEEDAAAVAAAPAPPSVRFVAGNSGNALYEVDAPEDGESGGALRFATWAGTDCGYSLAGGGSLSVDSGLLAIVPWALHDGSRTEEVLNDLGLVVEATSAIVYKACDKWFACQEQRRGGFSIKLPSTC
jgi:hypothetical protein